MPFCVDNGIGLLGSSFLLKLRGVAGNDDGGNEICQNAAAAYGAEDYPCQPHEGGVNRKILRDAAADAVEHFVDIGFIELFIHYDNKPPSRECIGNKGWQLLLYNLPFFAVSYILELSQLFIKHYSKQILKIIYERQGWQFSLLDPIHLTFL